MPEVIDLHGLTRLQNASGTTVKGFLDLLRLCLGSTLVEHEGTVFMQRSGVCIGACLAPILSEMYLFFFFVDRTVQELLLALALNARSSGALTTISFFMLSPPHMLSSFWHSKEKKEKHVQCFRLCRREKVYSMPFACGAECIGQMGRCVNYRV